MAVTSRDIDILAANARYYVTNRQQIQRLFFHQLSPASGSRKARGRLQELVRLGLLNRYHMALYDPGQCSSSPVYYPAKQGLTLLADHFGDARYYDVATRAPEATKVFHWLAVSDTHIKLDQAIARQHTVALEEWVNEWDRVEASGEQPEQRYRLSTTLAQSPRRVVCSPDGAFLLGVGNHKKVFYLEQERLNNPRQTAARKAPGYSLLAQRRMHRRHFPETTFDEFTVLTVATSAHHRDELRRAMRGKAGAAHWMFVSAADLTVEAFLHEPIIYPLDGPPKALVTLHKPSAPEGQET